MGGEWEGGWWLVVGAGLAGHIQFLDSLELDKTRCWRIRVDVDFASYGWGVCGQEYAGVEIEATAKILDIELE
jgi:hypothetical protein